MLRHIKNRAVLAVIFTLGTPFLASAVVHPSSQFYGRVTRVQSGDRLEVAWRGSREHIRVYGVECPLGRPGQQARHFTSEMAGSRGVSVHLREADGHGSHYAEVRFIGGRDLSEELLKNGMARWSRESAPHDKRLILLEAQARAARKGFWATPSVFVSAPLIKHHHRHALAHHHRSHPSQYAEAPR